MEGTNTLRPDRVFVFSQNVIAEIANGALILRPRPVDQIANNSIDMFFHSLAQEYREKAIAIIFAGMGSDGLTGTAQFINSEAQSSFRIRSPHPLTVCQTQS